MDSVKEAFQKVKQDISSLKKECLFLRESVTETREKMVELCNILVKINKKVQDLASTQEPPETTTKTHNTTNTTVFKPLKAQNMPFSTGNEGASTDRQTDRQTDKYAQNSPENTFENASELLDSLDSIKKEIRLKFKRLTDQEILVFSKLYQLEEEKGFADYKTLSDSLNLTESSIRDYVGRIIKKGVPVEKRRINNKNIQLSIDPNLKKIASLHTILHLRSL